MKHEVCWVKMIAKTYKAKLYSPLFYSTSEGRTIKTEKILSSTALLHALGYNYYGLQKKYFLEGNECKNYDYSNLKNLPIFTSDVKPIDVNDSERTFRSVDYLSDRFFLTTAQDLAKSINGGKGVPKIAGKSIAGWKRERRYTGISPGSVFEFTVWSEEELHDVLRFKMGIKRSGEFKAEHSDDTEEVILNKFLLQNVYEIDEELLAEIGKKADLFVRGNDHRLQHFIEVPMEIANKVAEEVLNVDQRSKTEHKQAKLPI